MIYPGLFQPQIGWVVLLLLGRGGSAGQSEAEERCLCVALRVTRPAIGPPG